MRSSDVVDLGVKKGKKRGGKGNLVFYPPCRASVERENKKGRGVRSFSIKRRRLCLGKKRRRAIAHLTEGSRGEGRGPADAISSMRRGEGKALLRLSGNVAG